MADANNNYAIRQLAVDTVSQTPVVCPIDCNQIFVKNSVAVDLKIRSDSGDGTRQDTIAAGVEEDIAGVRSAAPPDGGQARFLNGQTVGFLQAVSGTGPVILKFIR